MIIVVVYRFIVRVKSDIWLDILVRLLQLAAITK